MDITSIVSVLQAMEPFKTVSPDVLQDLAGKLQYKVYPENSYMFKQGSKSLGLLFLIVDGLVEITVTNDKGVESVFSFRRQYDFFGETAVLSGKSYPASARAKKETHCLLLTRQHFEGLIHNNHEFASHFTAILSERMRTLYEEVVAEQSYEAYSNSESPLFRKRVSELMSSPVITCQVDDTVAMVARTMEHHNISGVIVVDSQNRPVGLLTEKDLVRRLITSDGPVPTTINAGAVMNPVLIRVDASAYFNEALLAVVQNQVKHLAVMDQDRLIGIITLADLLKTRATGTLLVVHDIETQTTLEGLAAIGRVIDNVLNAMVAEKATAWELFGVLHQMHDRLTRRVITLCEQEMIQEGFGPPPVEYCWLNMGSAGRKEQYLRTDQDNALIYADNGDAEQNKPYFLTLAGKVVDGLAACGFAKCKGNVVASNPQWCKSLGQWEETMQRWIHKVEPFNIRMLTIFLDFRAVYGATQLAKQLWDTIFGIFEQSYAISHMMTFDDNQFRVPVSLLGGFVTEKSGPHKNEINLKTAACTHIVNCLRIFAVKNRISETATFERLRLLTDKKAIPADDAELFHFAYETLMMFRIRENLKKAKQGKEPDNYINPHLLSKREQSILKDSFSAISRLQKLTSNSFSIFWLNYLN